MPRGTAGAGDLIRAAGGQPKNALWGSGLCGSLLLSRSGPFLASAEAQPIHRKFRPGFAWKQAQ